MVVVVVVLVAVLLLRLPLLHQKKNKNWTVCVTTPPNEAQTTHDVTWRQGTDNDGHLAAGHRWTIYVVPWRQNTSGPYVTIASCIKTHGQGAFETPCSAALPRARRHLAHERPQSTKANIGMISNRLIM